MMGRIYASSGIPVYWIINLVDSQIEVYTNPDRSLGQYDARVDYKPGEDVPVVIEGHEITRVAVADLLPRRS